jgi:callose synthase
MRRRNLSEDQLWEKDDAYELRLWASYRGQTLARTVRGMMYYERCVNSEAFIKCTDMAGD